MGLPLPRCLARGVDGNASSASGGGGGGTNACQPAAAPPPPSQLPRPQQRPQQQRQHLARPTVARRRSAPTAAVARAAPVLRGELPAEVEAEQADLKAELANDLAPPFLRFDGPDLPALLGLHLLAAVEAAAASAMPRASGG